MIEKLVKYFEFQMQVMDKIGKGEYGTKMHIWDKCFGAIDLIDHLGIVKTKELEELWKEWSERLWEKVEE